MRRRALLAASSNGESGGFEIDTSKYLTIVALEDGVTVEFDKNANVSGFLEYYSSRYKRWSNDYNVTINTNEYLCFRGNLKPSTTGVGMFYIKGAFALDGNCMSLLFENDADTHLSLEGYDCCFYGLFYGCSDLISVSPKFLPATTLANHCYRDMFDGCTSLTTAPELPATTLANHCYRDMFDGCTSLTTAPELPATTLAEDCYRGMFENCISLTTAPALPATTLANHCYRDMFDGCTSLTTAPELPATTLVLNCYNSMFENCSRLNYIKALFTTSPGVHTNSWVYGVATRGTFVKSKNATWSVRGKDGIPKNWTVITE